MFQVLAIRLGQQQLVKDIRKFIAMKNDRVERELELVGTRRDTLDDTKKDCDLFVKTSHVVKIVEERTGRTAVLKESLKPSVSSSNLMYGSAGDDQI